VCFAYHKQFSATFYTSKLIIIMETILTDFGLLPFPFVFFKVFIIVVYNIIYRI
jgi:hypothetical protein